MIEVNKDLVKKHFTNNKRYSAYDTTVDIANHLKFHIDGYNYHDIKAHGQKENPWFAKLIDTIRPSESEHIKQYRRIIYTPETKQPCYKVINSLKKIVKSKDWKIDFSHAEKPARIREDEQLEVYTTKRLPYTGSIESWFYNIGLNEIISDPNGLIVTLPISYEVEKTDFRKPYPFFIASEKIYDFKEGEYAIFESNITYEYGTEGAINKDFVKVIVTKETVFEVRKINSKGDYSITEVLKLNFNRLPVRRAGGIYKCIIDNSVIYDSFLSPILPGLDKAARESSDLDAEVVQHIFSTMWYYASQGCNTCSGTGSVIKEGKQIVCGKCEGAGVLAKSPYKDLVIKTPSIDDQSIKPPFAGYIEKNTEIVKIQDERIEGHIYKALSAINMEFLANTPLSQSGKAKEVDKDELNNFVYGVAYHSVENVIKPIYQDANDIRVMDLNLSEKDREAMIPQITVPERFEILSENYLIDQVVASKKGELDPFIVSAQEIELVEKKFEGMPDIKDSFKVIKLIDPLPDMSSVDIDNSVLNGTVLKSDAIIHKYKNFFVKKATIDNQGFLQMDLMAQLEIIKKYADEKILELDKEDQAKQARNTQNIVGQINAA